MYVENATAPAGAAVAATPVETTEQTGTQTNETESAPNTSSEGGEGEKAGTENSNGAKKQGRSYKKDYENLRQAFSKQGNEVGQLRRRQQELEETLKRLESGTPKQQAQAQKDLLSQLVEDPAGAESRMTEAITSRVRQEEMERRQADEIKTHISRESARLEKHHADRDRITSDPKFREWARAYVSPLYLEQADWNPEMMRVLLDSLKLQNIVMKYKQKEGGAATTQQKRVAANAAKGISPSGRPAGAGGIKYTMDSINRMNEAEKAKHWPHILEAYARGEVK